MLPRKFVPVRWQATQDPAPLPIVLLWFMVSIAKLDVLRWQASKPMPAPPVSAVSYGMWLAGFARPGPAATWHLPQVPGATPAWLKHAGTHATGLRQGSEA